MPEIVVTLDIGGSGVQSEFASIRPGDVATDRPPSCANPSADSQDEGTFDPKRGGLRTAISRPRAARCLLPCPATALPGHHSQRESAFPLCSSMLISGVVGPSLLNRDRRRAAADRGRSRRLHRPTQAPTRRLDTGQRRSSACLSWPGSSAPTLPPGSRWRTILQLHDWFIFSLCGAIVSEASSARHEPDDWTSLPVHGRMTFLASECGVRDEMMPQFRGRPGPGLADLLRMVAEQVGLPAGLPVHLGAGDTHMSATCLLGARRPVWPVVGRRNDRTNPALSRVCPQSR